MNISRFLKYAWWFFNIIYEIVNFIHKNACFLSFFYMTFAQVNATENDKKRSYIHGAKATGAPVEVTSVLL